MFTKSPYVTWRLNTGLPPRNVTRDRPNKDIKLLGTSFVCLSVLQSRKAFCKCIHSLLREFFRVRHNWRSYAESNSGGGCQISLSDLTLPHPSSQSVTDNSSKTIHIQDLNICSCSGRYQTLPLGSKSSFLLWYRHLPKLLIQRL